MKFQETSNLFALNKYTYINLRWIAYLGQLSAILVVKFLLEFNFNYLSCLAVLFISILTNLYLEFKIKKNQLNNLQSTFFLFFDIAQLGILLFFTGGITNPFIILIIIPSVFSSQYLNIYSSVILVLFTALLLILLTFFYYDLPHPDKLHFHAPDYYLYAVPLSIFIGLNFLVYFGLKFGNESRIRKRAYDKIQEIMAKENELLSLGGQAAAAAHSLGTPLSTILLTARELQKEFGENKKFAKDLELLISQSKRCSEILKKLSLNPTIEDDFLDSKVSINDYVNEIVRSFKEISEKKIIVNSDNYLKKIDMHKSTEIIYGLRNFIGNANKFSSKKVVISVRSNDVETNVIISDDGPGFPKDLISKHKLGEPYIRTTDDKHIAKYGLGLGTFIGKTLLEKNFADVSFNNKIEGGAEVIIKWKNNDLKNI